MTQDRTGDAGGRFRGDPFRLSNYGGPEPLQGALEGVKFEWLDYSAKQRQLRWRLTVFDLRGGWKQRGQLEVAHAYLKASTAYNGYEGHLHLPPLSSVTATPDPTAVNATVVSYANIFGTLIWAVGEGVNVTLVKEASATNPTPTAITFTPNNEIYAMAPLVIGGASADLQLAVVGEGVGEILSDAAATSSGDMHANTALCWGIIQSPLPDGTIHVYRGTTWGTMLKTGAIGADPTVTLSNVPAGGYLVGWNSSIFSGQARIIAVIPRRGLNLPMPRFQLERLGDLVAVDKDGTTMVDVRLPIPLKGIQWCSLFRDGIVYSDGFEAAYFDGRVSRHLRLFENAEPNSNLTYRVRGFYVRGARLFIEVNKIASTNGSGNTQRAVWEYDWDLGASYPVTLWEQLSATGVQGIGGGPGLPVSDQTGFGHIYADGSWRRSYLPAFGESLYQLRQTASAGATTGIQFATAATASLPSLIFPAPITYSPKMVDRMFFGGELRSGETVKLTFGGVNHTFTAPAAAAINDASRIREFTRNQDFWLFADDGEIVLTQQAANTYSTPNALPLVIEGHADEVEGLQKAFNRYAS